MKKQVYWWRPLSLALFSSLALNYFEKGFALDIDEKLTTRILKTSQSQKTVLVNRGSEDGLNEGDHAKFYLTTGVIARGVLVKVSPARSIWSIYRLIDRQKIQAETVCGLKITEPVKITDDPSRMLVADDGTTYGEQVPQDLLDSDDVSKGSSGPEEKIPFPGDVPVEKRTRPIVIGSKSKKTSASSGSSSENWQQQESSQQKQFEVWAYVPYVSLSAKYDTNGSETASSQIGILDFTFGVEKYFSMSKQEFLKRFSIAAFFHYGKQNFKPSRVSEGEISIQVMEVGAAASIHLRDPSTLKAINPYFVGQFALGQTEFADLQGDTYAGSSNAFTLGGGLKYTLTPQIMFRAQIDYYLRSESYEFNDGSTLKINTTGPRVGVGLGIRF